MDKLLRNNNLLETLQIIAIIFSVSLRSANIAEKPYDYEYAGGIKSNHYSLSFLSERENGGYYYGIDNEIDLKYIKLKNYKRTSKNIDSQTISALYPIKKFSFGLSLNAKYWKDTQPLLSAVWKGNYVKINYSRGVERENIEVDIRHKIKVTEKISFVPLCSIRKFDDNFFWQTKIGFEYKIFKVR